MKTIMTLVFTVLSSCAFALTETIDGVTWTYRVIQGGAIVGWNYADATSQSYVPAVSVDTSGSIEIPQRLGGYPVVGIGRMAFFKCQNLTRVLIPNTVTNIDSSAFSLCYQLSHMTIPGSVKQIGERAFSYCTNLENVEFNEGLETLGSYLFNQSKGNGFGKLTDEFRLPSTVRQLYVDTFPATLNQTWRQKIFFTGDYPKMVGTSSYALLNGTTFYYVEGNTSWEASSGYIWGATKKPGAVTVQFLDNNRRATDRHIFSSGELAIRCINNNATIYYTLDASEPSKHSLEYTGPIPAGKYIVKAIAVVPEYPYTITETCSFALGQTVVPTIYTDGGNVFYLSGKVVSLSTETEGAEIHYTLDGSEPTENSKLYTGPFTIDDTTTIKAKAFKTDWFDSETATATFTREWYTVEAPVIEPTEAEFANVSQEVSIACATEGATIYYTTDGTDPAENGLAYKRPFTIYKSCTVRAVAKKYDWKDSAEETATFTRAESLSEASNLFGYTMESDAAAPWVVDSDMSHDGVSSVRSGTIGNNGVTTLSVSLRKAGSVSFWWRAKCENAEEEGGETYYYDYGSFVVDGNVVARIAGNDTGWKYVSHEIATGGKHVLSWEYRKDGATSYAPDCVWVDQVQWIPADGSGHTLTTPEPVPYAWLDQYNLGVGTDYETAGNAASGKVNWGRPTSVWEEYVAGLDPTDANSRLVANIEMRDGAPYVSWTPDLNTNGIIRTYKVYGSETLENGGNWQYPTNSLHRFFRVKVEMP